MRLPQEMVPVLIGKVNDIVKYISVNTIDDEPKKIIIGGKIQWNINDYVQ